MNRFEKYYNRICVGSDWPEFNQNLFIEKMRFYLDGLNQDKVDRILNKNIIDIIG